MRTPELLPRGRVLLDWMGVHAKITALAAGSMLLAAGLPSAAQAEPGLTVDPQSPAGVEYAVPIDQGRGHGGPGNGAAGGGKNSSPTLFGSGIKPSGSGSSGGNGDSGDGGSDSKDGKGADKRGDAKPPRDGGSAGQPAVTAANAAASYSATGPIAGLIAAILVGGGGLGLFLRLRRGKQPSSTSP